MMAVFVSSTCAASPSQSPTTLRRFPLCRIRRRHHHLMRVLLEVLAHLSLQAPDSGTFTGRHPPLRLQEVLAPQMLPLSLSISQPPNRRTYTNT